MVVGEKVAKKVTKKVAKKRVTEVAATWNRASPSVSRSGTWGSHLVSRVATSWQVGEVHPWLCDERGTCPTQRCIMELLSSHDCCFGGEACVEAKI